MLIGLMGSHGVLHGHGAQGPWPRPSAAAFGRGLQPRPSATAFGRGLRSRSAAGLNTSHFFLRPNHEENVVLQMPSYQLDACVLLGTLYTSRMLYSSKILVY